MAAGPRLELEGVSKRFGRVTVADSLSLAVGRSETLGIVGPNGAGKTSVFGLISGDLAPDQGRVVFEGEAMTHLDSSRRCRLGIGRTYQVPRPFEQMTVFENVLVAAQAGARLKRAGAQQLAWSVLSDTGLASIANRPAGQLGLMHRKRLELARALATRPRLLLLDEVAAGLTDREVSELVAIVVDARDRLGAEDGLSIIWVEHVVRALVTAVDRLICLDVGLIVADGPPEEVLADQRVKDVYLGADVVLPAEPPGGHADLLDVGGDR